ncbi:hypothetical protein L249_1399 [Ophiocordyceps polyrhachis-furcata BCC 54312]|uniref:Uncharacterized protein n=1 Tax=Ophiocordyceps polyrhachis-furcata BCC 54312 TaxID=1330021 RepID=A0A367L468_9HYPO|nr:hypothetical protein L249_1399 [Ophiocordyceps polyrhachis-furcata BCC 54312]
MASSCLPLNADESRQSRLNRMKLSFPPGIQSPRITREANKPKSVSDGALCPLPSSSIQAPPLIDMRTTTGFKTLCFSLSYMFLAYRLYGLTQERLFTPSSPPPPPFNSVLTMNCVQQGWPITFIVLFDKPGRKEIDWFGLPPEGESLHATARFILTNRIAIFPGCRWRNRYLHRMSLQPKF